MTLDFTSNLKNIKRANIITQY